MVYLLVQITFIESVGISVVKYFELNSRSLLFSSSFSVVSGGNMRESSQGRSQLLRVDILTMNARPQHFPFSIGSIFTPLKSFAVVL